MFPKIVVPPNHPLKHRVFHYFHHPFWGGFPLFSETSIYSACSFFSISKGIPVFSKCEKNSDLPFQCGFLDSSKSSKSWKFHRNDPQDPWLPDDIVTDMNG